MDRNRARPWLYIVLPAALSQIGCTSFVQAELEALLAPAATGNALAVLNSVLFEWLAPLLY